MERGQHDVSAVSHPAPLRSLRPPRVVLQWQQNDIARDRCLSLGRHEPDPDCGYTAVAHDKLITIGSWHQVLADDRNLSGPWRQLIGIAVERPALEQNMNIAF